MTVDLSGLVKPLQFATWENAGAVDRDGLYHDMRALSRVGCYFLLRDPITSNWVARLNGHDVGPWGSVEAAQAAANADHAARVLAALDTALIEELVGALEYGERMCRLDLHRQIDKESDDFSQAVWDTWQRIDTAIAKLKGGA